MKIFRNVFEWIFNYRHRLSIKEKAEAELEKPQCLVVRLELGFNGCGIALYINIKSLLYNSQNLVMTYSVIYSCD